MNVTNFSDKQKQALLDLLVLGMYADGHLAAVEDLRIQKLLATMQFSSEHAKAQFVDASIARVRLHDSRQSLPSLLTEIGNELSTPESRRRAIEAVDELLSSDNRITDKEREFLASVRSAFGQ